MNVNARSSKGRTFGSDPKNVGSIPTHAAKICTKCKKKKSKNDFYKRGSSTQSWCKLCKTEWDRESYKENKNKRQEQIKNRKRKNKEEIQKYIASLLKRTPCYDCGNNNIIVLEFDHIKEKDFNISEAIFYGYSLNRIKKEIQKCDIVCANCHRIRTSQRMNSWKMDFI